MHTCVQVTCASVGTWTCVHVHFCTYYCLRNTQTYLINCLHRVIFFLSLRCTWHQSGIVVKVLHLAKVRSVVEFPM